LIIVDEFAFINMQLFLKIITPLMLVARTSLLCISTMNRKNITAYNNLFDEDDDERMHSATNQSNVHLYKRFTYSFVCPNCLLKGITTECKHLTLRAPAWHRQVLI
jgi:hypothetical protein